MTSGTPHTEHTHESLARVFHMLRHGQRSGSIVLRAAGASGTIHVIDGAIVHAEHGDTTGERAVFQMLAWAQPSIQVRDQHATPDHTISPQVSALVIEAAEEQDNWEMTERTAVANAPVVSELRRSQPQPRARAAAPCHETYAGTLVRGSVLDALCEPLLHSRTVAPVTPFCHDTPPDISTRKTAGPAYHQALTEIMLIDGALAVAIVNWQTGELIDGLGSGVNLSLAAAGNSEVVRAKMKVMHALGLNDRIEDILITLGGQLHLIRLLDSNTDLFLYVILERAVANLGMARMTLQQVESRLTRA